LPNAAQLAEAALAVAHVLLALGVHAGLLLLALAVFARVSWRLWPARVFALPAEFDALRRRFRLAALTLLGTVGLATALGVAAQVLRTGGR
jgi:hypothetical protein